MELLALELVHHYQSQTRLPCAAAIEAIGETYLPGSCPPSDPITAVLNNNVQQFSKYNFVPICRLQSGQTASRALYSQSSKDRRAIGGH